MLPPKRYILEHDGDQLEKQFYSRLSPSFPYYETFWQKVIVPFTLRDIDGTLGIRPGVDKDLELMAMSHYSCYCHLGIAHELLGLVADRAYLYDDYFFHIDAAIEMVQGRFVRYCDKVWAKTGQVRDRLLFKARLGADWQRRAADLDMLAAEAARYRNAFTHDPRIGRIIEKDDRSWIPGFDALGPDTNLAWSDVVAMSFPKDFVRLDDLAQHLMEEVPSSVNALWPEIISAFESLSTLDAYQQLARTGQYAPEIDRRRAESNNLPILSYNPTLSGTAQPGIDLPYTGASGTFPPPTVSSID